MVFNKRTRREVQLVDIELDNLVEVAPFCGTADGAPAFHESGLQLKRMVRGEVVSDEFCATDQASFDALMALSVEAVAQLRMDAETAGKWNW